METEDKLILVDRHDRQVGIQDKATVHALGLLHRAFSVFIFNRWGQLLLQQRAGHKYHSPELWTNTCCSHPRPGESLDKAVNRRLQEEMGLQCKTDYVFQFKYHAPLPNGLIEHEIDHVYFGMTDNRPVINPAEVKNWKYMELPRLAAAIQQNPEQYTPWLRICLDRVIGQLPAFMDVCLNKKISHVYA
jgi:isopentenyl-diphosphate Delta-isomerase